MPVVVLSTGNNKSRNNAVDVRLSQFILSLITKRSKFINLGVKPLAKKIITTGQIA